MNILVRILPFLVSCAAGFLPMAVSAQTSLADLKTQLDARSSELDEVDQLLSDVDPNRRAAAIELLLDSGNPQFIERATTAGLMSSDPVMRASAMQAALQNSSTLALEIDLTDEEEEKTKIRYWLKSYAGSSWDETDKSAVYIFRIGEFDAKQKCWLNSDNKKCSLVVNGEQVMLTGWSYAIGGFELSDEGTLQGTFSYNHSNDGMPLPATIRLFD